VSKDDLASSRARLRAAADALSRVAAQELAALTDAEALGQTRSLRLLDGGALPTSSSSGLVEQQALFLRLARP